MELGVAFPHIMIGGDPLVVRDFAQAVEGMGYAHLVVADHVLGENRPPDQKHPYTIEHFHHDPFVFFSYVAAHTERITLAPHVLVLPQRQTALVAKQAASLDYLSGGRVRLGVGVGWNDVEYVALGESFRNRGARSEEQIAVLRALWQEESVTFDGRWHRLPDVGINPRPVQRPIPIWLGGRSERTLARIGRIGDGWVTIYHRPDGAMRAAIETVHTQARAAGRGPGAIGLDAWTSADRRTPDEWRAEVSAWRELGMTHLTLHTGFERFHHRAVLSSDPVKHLETIERFRAAVADLLNGD